MTLTPRNKFEEFIEFLPDTEATRSAVLSSNLDSASEKDSPNHIVILPYKDGTVTVTCKRLEMLEALKERIGRE